MEAQAKNCQSCGMPMRRDPNGGGTNANGSTNLKYCSHCYAGGRFTHPDMTVEQMQARVREKLREFGVPAPLSWFLTRRVPKLERWSGTSRP
jgi:hypothetical protein